MDTHVYARVLDGEVRDFPISKEHIQTQVLPMEWFKLCQIDEVPTLEIDERCSPIFIVEEDVVVVRWKIQRLTDTEFVGRIWMNRYPELRQEAKLPTEYEAHRLKRILRSRVLRVLDEKAREEDYADFIEVISFSRSSNPDRAALAKKFYEDRDKLFDYVDKILVDSMVTEKRILPRSPQEFDSWIKQMIQTESEK